VCARVCVCVCVRACVLCVRVCVCCVCKNLLFEGPENFHYENLEGKLLG